MRYLIIYAVGLDPPTLTTLSPLLYGLAKSSAPRLLLALRPQDPIPDWITHVLYLEPSLRIAFQGDKNDVLGKVKSTLGDRQLVSVEFGRKLTDRGIEEGHDHATMSSDSDTRSPESLNLQDESLSNSGEPLVEMENVQVRYGEKQVLGGWTENINGKSQHGLSWTVRRGQRWGVFGPNGGHNLPTSFKAITNNPRLRENNHNIPNLLRPPPSILAPHQDVRP